MVIGFGNVTIDPRKILSDDVGTAPQVREAVSIASFTLLKYEVQLVSISKVTVFPDQPVVTWPEGPSVNVKAIAEAEDKPRMSKSIFIRRIPG